MQLSVVYFSRIIIWALIDFKRCLNGTWRDLLSMLVDDLDVESEGAPGLGWSDSALICTDTVNRMRLI